MPVPFHPDRTLYTWIIENIASTVLQAFADQLTEQERWDLGNVLRQNFDRRSASRILPDREPQWLGAFQFPADLQQALGLKAPHQAWVDFHSLGHLVYAQLADQPHVEYLALRRGQTLQQCGG